MIVYAAADLHGNLPPVPSDAELLLLAGDICPDFNPPGDHWGLDRGGAQQANWLDTDFRRWLEALTDHGIVVVATWGNHDFVGERPGLVPRLPWVLLEDESAYIGGLHIYGTSWVPGLPYWAFYGDERRLQFRADAIPQCDILMSHGPPHGVGDYIPTSEKQRTKYGNYGGEHVGDPTLNDAISRARPRVVICGHIHEARGSYVMAAPTETPRFTEKPLDVIQFQNVRVYNVAAVDAVYGLHAQPWTRLPVGAEGLEPSRA